MMRGHAYGFDVKIPVEWINRVELWPARVGAPDDGGEPIAAADGRTVRVPDDVKPDTPLVLVGCNDGTRLVRFEVRVRPGEDVPEVGRGRLGVLWAGAQDRAQAMRVARGVLEETWVAGALETNQRFLGEVLTHPWVSEGIFHAGFIDEEFLPQLRPSADWLPFFASVCESISDNGEIQDIVRGGGTPSFR